MSNGVTAWSFSRLQTYEECAAKFKYQYIDKLIDFDSMDKPPAMVRGIEVHKECEAFLKDEEQMSENMHNFEEEFVTLKDWEPLVEQQWGFTEDWEQTGWFSHGARATWLRVIPDAVILYGDQTASVIDFKTGKPYGDNSDQMELFALATLRRYPTLTEVTTHLWYLDVGEEQEATFQRKGHIDRINEWVDRVEPMFLDTKFVPTPSDRACRFCKFSKAEGGPCKY